MSPEEHLGAAMFLLCSERPYLASALWSVRSQPRPGLGTMAVDEGWRMLYDPQKILTWSVDELAAVCAHEVSHLLRDHAARGKMFDSPFLWNVAADAEINDDLFMEGGVCSKLPNGAIYPKHLGKEDGLLAEEYYPKAEETASSSPLAEEGVTSGSCGGCATGGFFDLPGLLEPVGEAESVLLRRLVARDALEHHRSRGNVPGHWVRWAEGLLEPKADWRKELASLVRRALALAAGAVDYSYGKPSRRQGAAGAVVLPSMVAPVPDVAVVVDTSGSMGPSDLSRSLAEVKGILRALGARPVTALSVDAEVHKKQRLSKAKDVKLHGGGGTDMGAGIAAAYSLNPRPDVCVVLTDGFTPWPQSPPRNMSVVVACTTDVDVPSWARCVRVGE